MKSVGSKRQFKSFFRALRMIQNMTPLLIPATVLSALLQSFMPFIPIFMTARIIDELFGAKSVARLSLLVVSTIVLSFIVFLILKGTERIKEISNQRLFYLGKYEMDRLILRTNYENTEKPSFHLRKQKIEDASIIGKRGIWRIPDLLERTLTSFCTVVISIILAYPAFIPSKSQNATSFESSIWQSIVLIILVIFSSCYSLFSNSRFSKKLFKELDHGMKFNQLFSYYEDLLRDDNRFGKDVRIYHQSELIEKSFNDFNKLNTRFQSNIGRLQGRFSGINAAVTSIISGFVYLFVGIKALNGSISIGSVVQYVGAINQFTTSFSKMITSISDSWHNIKYVQLYFDFLDTPSLKSERQLPISIDRNSKYEIEFRNVSFKYLESDAYALRNISLKINSGERIAVVGMNGSGKTTFIKLLCRLYDPQEGQILLNGVNIQQYKFQDYMNFLSVVFQDFQLFAFPLGQNVSSDINYDEQRTLECLDEVGIGEKVRSLPNGLETPLYKVDEDGVDISGGEAQKIAIARALYKDSPFIILDEPTAALDPRAEFDIYSKLQRIAKNKTTIFISHRLSSCRFCNEILVLDKGKLIQKGTHDELVQDKSGKYFELWNAQAQYYQLNS